jgi:hypothetical protein
VTGTAWWERDPARVRRETEALDAAGIAWARTDRSEPDGVLAVDITVPASGGEPVSLHAVYPDDFPHFPPHVTGPDLGYEHHYQHGGGAVCLLATGGRGWLPSRTLAWLLTEQWPKVVAANDGDGTAPDGSLIETDQAEPWTAYVQTEHGPVVVLDSASDPPPGPGTGKAVFAVTRQEPLTAVVVSMSDEHGREIFNAGRINLSDATARPAVWVHLDDVPLTRDADSLWKAVVAQQPAVADEAWAPSPERGPVNGKRDTTIGRQAQVVLVRVPEETARRQVGTGWIALVRHRSQPRKPPSAPKAYRVSRAGRTDLYRRAPEAAAIATKSILVVGTGGLGAAITLEIGKLAPAALALMDADMVDMATAVRFLGAFRYGGLPKVTALAQMVVDTQPYTRLAVHGLQLGRPRPPDGENTLDVLDSAITNADIVIDATANLNAQQLLADRAREAGVCYLQAEATPGVWGGLIALYPPSSDLCWVCVQHHIDDQTIPPLPETTGPSVQPPGCLEPTYPGTGFDLAVIAAQTVRQAVSYLTDGPDGYGPPIDGVVTVALRDHDGRPVLPTWQHHDLDRHPACQNHP